MTTGLAGVGTEYGGREGVGCFHHARGSDEIGDDLAGCTPVEVAGLEVVGRVDHYSICQVQTADGLDNLRPHHRDHDDVAGRSLLDRPGRHPGAAGLDRCGQRLGSAAVGDDDLPAGAERDLRHGLADASRTDDSDANHWLPPGFAHGFSARVRATSQRRLRPLRRRWQSRARCLARRHLDRVRSRRRSLESRARRTGR